MTRSCCHQPRRQSMRKTRRLVYVGVASGAEPTPAPSPRAPAAGRRWRRAWGGAGRRPSVFPVHHQSNHQSKWLALLLNEIAQEVRDEVGPWATAFVIRSGSTCLAGATLRWSPRDSGRGTGKTAFCWEQRRLSVEWIRDHPDAWRRSGPRPDAVALDSLGSTGAKSRWHR